MTKRFFLLLISLLLASCTGKNNGNELPPEPEIQAEFTEFTGLEDISAGSAAVSCSVSFNATADWRVESSAGWISAVPSSGEAGKSEIQISLKPNDGTGARYGTVSFICGEDSRSMKISQEGREPGPRDVYLNSHFSSLMHYSTGRLRTMTAVMQSFDISADGKTIYYTQLNNKFRVYLSWGPRNGKSTPSTYMTLNYTGHGSNFTIEEASDGVWLWMDNYSGKNASGDYWGAQTISRFPVKSGITLNAWDASENYYFGESNISAAVDVEGDMLTVLGISSGRIRTYRLSELKALPVENIQLSSITYGGEDKAPHAETTLAPVIKGRNATRLTPLGDFTIQREKYPDGSTVSWQGFDVHGGYIYQAQGNGHADGTPSPGWLQKRKIDGSVVVPLTLFTALEDLDALKSAGITDIGYMEPEGVKYRDGIIYCGFASKNAANERRGTIFNYNPDLLP